MPRVPSGLPSLCVLVLSSFITVSCVSHFIWIISEAAFEDPAFFVRTPRTTPQGFNFRFATFPGAAALGFRTRRSHCLGDSGTAFRPQLGWRDFVTPPTGRYLGPCRTDPGVLRPFVSLFTQRTQLRTSFSRFHQDVPVTSSSHRDKSADPI